MITFVDVCINQLICIWYICGIFFNLFPLESHERLVSLYDRLEELDASKATSKAAFILHGLGFTKEMQQTQVLFI